jgi:hypothetical protein
LLRHNRPPNSFTYTYAKKKKKMNAASKGKQSGRATKSRAAKLPRGEKIYFGC